MDFSDCFSSWNHSTDTEFLSKLTFNDQTNMFYSSYGAFENGELTSVGVSFPTLSNNGRNAEVEGAKSKWYRKASGRLENVYPEFDLLFASTKAGWNIVKSAFSSICREIIESKTNRLMLYAQSINLVNPSERSYIGWLEDKIMVTMK